MKKWKSIHIADRAVLENFMALLARSGHWAFCGRAHKDEISKLIGIDPNCAKNHHLPHDIAAANIAWNAATNCWAWSPMTWRHVFNDLQLTPRGMKPRRRRRAI